MEVEGLEKNYDELKVINNFSLNVENGERIAVIGKNGIGKTTLLESLVQNIKIDSGKINWNKNVNIGYFSQNHNMEFNQDITLINWMKQWAQKDDDMQSIRGTLGRLLFHKIILINLSKCYLAAKKDV